VKPDSRLRLVAGVIVLLLLSGLAALSIAAIAPPAAAAADARPDEFSANRAFGHVEAIGSQVHPAGSAGADAVRDYLMTTLTGFGLQPRIQEAVGADGALSGPYGMARVHNVIALLPGTAPTGRVVMFAHYDSVQVSFGGNDDGAGVSTLLETARAVLAGPRPTNDIVFLFTDAEEACLCGAEAFVGQDPLAAGGGVALNFESRGTTGPTIMFETSRGNAATVDLYGGAVPFPVATSFAVEVYRTSTVPPSITRRRTSRRRWTGPVCNNTAITPSRWRGPSASPISRASPGPVQMPPTFRRSACSCGIPAPWSRRSPWWAYWPWRSSRFWPAGADWSTGRGLPPGWGWPSCPWRSPRSPHSCCGWGWSRCDRVTPT
jgi:hypothetical protein